MKATTNMVSFAGNFEVPAAGDTVAGERTEQEITLDDHIDSDVGRQLTAGEAVGDEA
jgi:hypothetical protein